MAVFWVFKKEWLEYMEDKGKVVIADDWMQAKGIAMADWNDENLARNNVEVVELDISQRGVVTSTNWISKDKIKENKNEEGLS